MDDSSLSSQPKIFKYMAKRPKTGLQPFTASPNLLTRTESEHTPRCDIQTPQIQLRKVQSRASTNASKTIATRPSTRVQSAKSGRPHSMMGHRGIKIDIISPAGSPRSALQSPKSAFGSPRSPLSANQKFKFSNIEANGNASPFPVFSSKSPRATLNTLLSFYENTSDSHMKLLQQSEDIIQESAQVQQKAKKGYLSHRRTISLNEKKASEQIKVQTMDECVLPGKEGPDQKIPTVKRFLDNVKSNLDYCKRRDVQHILQYTNNHHNIKEHLLKIGLTSPRSLREKEMFQSFDKNIDAYIFNNTQKMRDDIMNKKWSIVPNTTKARKSIEKEPLIFSQNFNMRKYCKSRGLNSITEALRSHNEKAWNIALREPHKIQDYLEMGDRNTDALSQSSSDSD